MEIAIIGKNSIKIKGKQTTFIVDPSKDMSKTSADAIILLNGLNNIDNSRVTDSRIVISGPGGYEVGGVKISGTTTSKGTLYKITIDDLSVIVGRSSESKAEGFSSCQIAVINTNDEFNGPVVTALEPKMIVLYGDKKEEAVKTLGVESVTPAPKIVVIKDKLPEKMEIVVLE